MKPKDKEQLIEKSIELVDSINTKNHVFSFENDDMLLFKLSDKIKDRKFVYGWDNSNMKYVIFVIFLLCYSYY